MRKFKLFLIVTAFAITPIFANEWRDLGKNCSKRVSFFGILTVWSGSHTEGEYDSNGNPTGNTRHVPCTSDGNWDWAW